MMKSQTLTRWILPVLTSLILPLTLSCSVAKYILGDVGFETKVERLNVDPSFAANRVVAGGISIIGGTSLARETYDDFESLASELYNDFGMSQHQSVILEESLQSKREEIPIASWAEVRQTIGDARIGQSLRAFHDHRMLQASILDTLASELENVSQYVLIYLIIKDATTFSEDECDEEDDYIYYNTKREISVFFSIYDLVTGNAVLKAIVASEEENTQSFRETNVVEDILDGIFGGTTEESPYYPERPSQDSIMKNIFDKFADQLPETD